MRYPLLFELFAIESDIPNNSAVAFCETETITIGDYERQERYERTHGFADVSVYLAGK